MRLITFSVLWVLQVVTLLQGQPNLLKALFLFPVLTDTAPHGTLWAQQRSSTSLSV